MLIEAIMYECNETERSKQHRKEGTGNYCIVTIVYCILSINLKLHRLVINRYFKKITHGILNEITEI